MIGINQSFIPDFVQDTTYQDNIGEPPIQGVALEEQTLTPQEHMSLRRSIREKKSAVPDNYIVFI